MSRPLKVLIWFWGRRGGGPRYTLELAKVLESRGDVDLFLSLSRQSDFFQEFARLKVQARLDVNTYSSLPSFVMSSLQLPFLRRRFTQFLHEQKIDVVLCTMDHLWNFYMADAVHDAEALYMLTVHDATRHPGEDQHWRQRMLARDIVASGGALVLTRSVGELLQSVHAYPADRIFESTHGHFGEYILDKPRVLPKNRPIRLLFFGRILPYKGLDMLLAAMPLLQSRHPGLELEIWGSGDIAPYRKYIEGLAGIRLENRWIDEMEIPRIFERNDLLMLPYREASQSGVVGMAQAYGMPSVATPIPGLCEQVADGVNGVVVTAANSDSLVGGVTSLIEQPKRYTCLSQGCLATAQHELSWELIGETVLTAIRSLRKIGKR